MQPAHWNPVGICLQFVKSCFKLTEGHGEIIIYYSFVKKMTILPFHYLGRFNHFLKVFLLQKEVFLKTG